MTRKFKLRVKRGEAERTLRSCLKNLLLLLHGLTDWLKILISIDYTLTYILMQIKLVRYATERHKTTVSADFSLGWESDAHYCQQGRFF